MGVITGLRLPDYPEQTWEPRKKCGRTKSVVGHSDFRFPVRFPISQLISSVSDFRDFRFPDFGFPDFGFPSTSTISTKIQIFKEKLKTKY